MQLENKTAVVYGAAGTIGSVVARTFAREGAHVQLAGRTKATLDAVAEEIRSLTDDDVPQLVRDTILGRLPRLTELAGTAVYLASDAAAAVTGVAVNMSCGAVFG